MQSDSDFYDHYKETFTLQRDYLSERNKLTAWMLVLLVLMAGFIYDPTMLNDKVNQYVASQVDGLAFEMKYLNTGIIFLLLWVMTRYYQVVLQIEKMYHYIEECENELSKNGEFKINREGSFYLKSYPWLSDVVDYCYVVLLPLAIITIAIIKIVKECSWATNFKIADFIGLGLIIFISLLYLSNRKLKEEFFDKTRYKKMGFFDRLWHYLRLKK